MTRKEQIGSGRWSRRCGRDRSEGCKRGSPKSTLHVRWPRGAPATAPQICASGSWTPGFEGICGSEHEDDDPSPQFNPGSSLLAGEDTVKAFIVDKYQKKGALRLAEMPEPEIRDDDVLVRVHAAAVNLLDSKVRDGEFKLFLPYRPPFVLGHDVAGTVTRVGSKVRRLKVGDEVYARPRDHRVGTFAQLIAMNEADVALKPKNVSMEEAASIPLAGLTAWQALVEVGKLKPGQKVFIQAGSGGVGTFAIQLAKHLGATVATTTSTNNVALVKNLGADVVIDYKTQDFEKALSGYDLVLHS